ncbi:MAG: ABC transporter ATP-binding protein [Erysipelotrichaceae bacterium]|nr:ABC transporter ATP-binding protein [Erysipelotrichaceae bacterium]
MFKLAFRFTGKYKVYAFLTPLFVALEVITDVTIPLVMKQIVDVGINGEAGTDINYVYKMGLLMVAMAAFAAVCGALAGLFSAKASGGFINNLREAMFNKIQDFSFANIEKFEIPSLVTRMTKDMRELRMAYNQIIRSCIRAPLQLIYATFIVYSLNAKLARVFFVAIPVLGFGLFSIFNQAHPRFLALMHRFDDMNADLEENLIGIRVVKTFVREDYEKRKFANTSKTVRDAQRHAEAIVILNGPFFSLVTYACMVAVSYFGGRYVIDGIMTTGDLMTYLSYLRQILFSLMGISFMYMQIVNAQASVDRANEILDEIIDIQDHENDPDLKPEDGSIVFDNVSFSYRGAESEKALDGISLTINSGEVIGIIGSTGSSKTTLVQLIPRLYDVSEGSIKVGGHDVREYKLNNLRKDVAMVLQKNLLFTGTIEENLRWGDENASHEEVVEAAQCAQAHDFISSFPKGYDTYLGQSGVNLSGGQQQRVCIARALLKKPKIIILDDSTSAVDTDTDKRIRKALKERLSGMTTIIIAQRIASVMDADKIIVMDEGKIADIGSHDELMARNEVYSDLYNTQTSGVSE